MSSWFSSGQFEGPFRDPRKLGNWERPDPRVLNPRRPASKSGVTKPIVDERGHILPGVPKKMTSFNPGMEIASTPETYRWPANPTANDINPGAPVLG